VFGKLFDFSRDWVFIVFVWYSALKTIKKVHYSFKFLCFIYLFSICNSHKLR
jgi:hypothetical protein